MDVFLFVFVFVSKFVVFLCLFLVFIYYILYSLLLLVDVSSLSLSSIPCSPPSPSPQSLSTSPRLCSSMFIHFFICFKLLIGLIHFRVRLHPCPHPYLHTLIYAVNSVVFIFCLLFIYCCRLEDDLVLASLH